MQEIFSQNTHLLPHCGQNKTFRKNENCNQYEDPHITDVEITRFYDSEDNTIARIFRISYDDGRPTTDTVRLLRVNNTLYHSAG
jgi:hypothetical protein